MGDNPIINNGIIHTNSSSQHNIVRKNKTIAGAAYNTISKMNQEVILVFSSIDQRPNHDGSGGWCTRFKTFP